MTVQVRVDNTNEAFVRQGLPIALGKDNETIAQDAGRTTTLAAGTIMAYNPTTAKWEPFTDETATDGTQYPAGVTVQDVTAAALVAGDVTGQTIITGDVALNESLITIENSKTLATIINVPAGLNSTVERELAKVGIRMQDTLSVDSFENS